jgi:hypothetical protein
MVLYALLACELINIGDPLQRLHFRSTLTQRGWMMLNPSFTVERAFVDSDQERAQRVRNEHGDQVDEPWFDPSFWYGIAAGADEIDRLTRADLVAAAAAAGVNTWSYALQVGNAPPFCSRSIDLQSP